MFPQISDEFTDIDCILKGVSCIFMWASYKGVP